MKNGIRLFTERTVRRDGGVQSMCALAREYGVRQTLDQKAPTRSIQRFIEAVKGLEVGVGRPMPLGNEEIEKAVAPRLPENVAEGTLRGVEEIDEGARYCPLECSVHLNGEIAHSFPEPIKQGELAVRGAHENTSKSQQLCRQEPICMRRTTSCVGSA
jgi:hypothetical protein